MGVADKYTTAELISKEEAAQDPEKPVESVEQKKILLSNDAYAICEHLETLINVMRRR